MGPRSWLTVVIPDNIIVLAIVTAGLHQCYEIKNQSKCL